MKKSIVAIFLTITISSSFAGEAEGCRLFIKGYQTLIGDSQELRASVEKSFAKKNIELIEAADLRDGDYTSDLLKNFEAYGALPLHGYLMSKKRKIILIPCTAIPLCSPIQVDEQVTSIDGIKYNDSIQVNILTSSGEKSLLEKPFRHAYRGETVSYLKDHEYFGSLEHIDLVMAVAKKAPSCKALKKSK